MQLRILLLASVLSVSLAVLIHLTTYMPGLVSISPLALLAPVPLLVPAIWKSVGIAKERNPVLDPQQFWKRTFEFAPQWTGKVILALFVFTVFNFLFSLLVLNEGLTPAVFNGQFVLHNHGKVGRVLSEAEFIKHKAYELRGMSTHVILIAVVTAAILWAEVRRTSHRTSQPGTLTENG